MISHAAQIFVPISFIVILHRPDKAFILEDFVLVLSTTIQQHNILPQPTMNSLKILLLSLWSLFSVSEAAKIKITNNCFPITIWPATLASPGSPQLSTTGFELGPGQSRTIDVPSPWTGRIWARSHCKHENGQLVCGTGDCGPNVECSGATGRPPVTLFEVNIAANGGQDFYDVSLVDGFNLPIQVTPTGGSHNCQSIHCPNVNHKCPPQLVIKDHDYPIACKSACLAFGEPRFCCGGMQPHECKPSEYSKLFKSVCPTSYSYAYDDPSSTFTCFGGPDYDIKFCA